MSSAADTGSHRQVNTSKRRCGQTHGSRCERCGVVSSWMPGHERRGLPAGWEKQGGHSDRLACRRARATEQADEHAPEGLTLEERAKFRTQALIEFEIVRDPDRPNGEIAKVVLLGPAVAQGAQAHRDGAQEAPLGGPLDRPVHPCGRAFDDLPVSGREPRRVQRP